jgi:hypothetical protein
MRYRKAALAGGIALLVTLGRPTIAQESPNKPHYVKSVKVPGLEVRFLDFKWDPEVFQTLERGGPHPVGRRSWVLARLLATTNPFRCEGKVIPVGPSLLILNPSQGGAAPTLELRSIDMREVFVNMNVIAIPPPGATYWQAPASFRKVAAVADRLEVTLAEADGSIDILVHYGDRETHTTLVRY